MSEQDKQCREAFEAWYGVRYGHSPHEANGASTSAQIICMWTGWQSAWNRRPQITVTKNESGQIVAVTRTDAEGEILEVIAESTPQAQLTEIDIMRMAEDARGFDGRIDYFKFAKSIAARCGDAQTREDAERWKIAVSLYAGFDFDYRMIEGEETKPILILRLPEGIPAGAHLDVSINAIKNAMQKEKQ